MSTDNFIEKLAAQFGQSATVNNVYGEPIRTGEKTILPVAQISYGCGGGYGHGKNKMNQLKEGEEGINGATGEGAGGGGGMYARAKGVYEITPKCTRFIPASGGRILVAGMVIGFILRGIYSHRHKNS